MKHNFLSYLDFSQGPCNRLLDVCACDDLQQVIGNRLTAVLNL